MPLAYGNPPRRHPFRWHLNRPAGLSLHLFRRKRKQTYPRGQLREIHHNQEEIPRSDPSRYLVMHAIIRADRLPTHPAWPCMCHSAFTIPPAPAARLLIPQRVCHGCAARDVLQAFRGTYSPAVNNISTVCSETRRGRKMHDF